MLVSSGDTAELAAALTQILLDRSVRHRLSRDGVRAAGRMDASVSMSAMAEAVRAAL